MATITGWFLTTTDDNALSASEWQKIAGDGNEIQIMGLYKLYDLYGEKKADGSDNENGIQGYRDIYDIWNFEIFLECLERAEDAGRLPDLLEMGSTWTQALATYLCDITELAISEKVDVVSEFLHRPRLTCCGEEGWPMAGRYHALPFTIDTRTWFYEVQVGDHSFRNLNLFQKKLREGNIRIALPIGSDFFHFLLPFLWSFGGGIVHPFTFRPLIANQQSEDALEWVVNELILSGVALNDPKILSLHDAEQKLLSGEAHIVTGGWWMWNELETKASGRNFRAALVPPYQLSAAFVGGTNLGIVRKHGDSYTDARYNRTVEALLQFTSVTYVQSLPRWNTPSNLPCPLNLTPPWRYNENVGKLPPQKPIWDEWVREDIIRGESKTHAFDDGFKISELQRFPSIPESAWIEQQMRDVFNGFFRKIQSVRTQAQANARRTGLTNEAEYVEKSVNFAIRQVLEDARKQLQDCLQDHIRVSTKNRTGRLLKDHGIFGRGFASQRFNKKAYDLLVDIPGNLLSVSKGTSYSEVPLNSLQSRLRDTLLMLVKEHKGKPIPLPPNSVSSLRSNVVDLTAFLKDNLLPDKDLFVRGVPTHFEFLPGVTVCLIDWV